MLKFGTSEVTGVIFNGQRVNKIVYVNDGDSNDAWNYAPTEPRNLSLHPTSSSLSVSWDAPSGGDAVTLYLVQYSTGSDFSNPTSINTSSRSTTITGLIGNTTYYVRVRAVGVYGSSDFTSSSDTTPPSIPSLGATRHDIDSIALNASLYPGTDKAYIDYKIGSGNWTALYVLTSSGTYYHNSISQGTTVNYRIRARSDTHGYSPYTTHTISATTGSDPTAPTISVSVSGQTNTINWSQVTGASGYYLYYLNGTYYSYLTTISSGSTTSYSHGSRPYASSMTYKLRAFTSYPGTDGSSALSNAATAVTQLAPITTNEETNTSVSGFRANWQASPTSNVTYKLEVRRGGVGTAWQAWGSTTNTYFNITGLNMDELVYWRVYATHGTYPQSAKSSIRSHRTNQGVLATPAPTATSTTNSATVSWGAITGAASYTLVFHNSTYNMGSTRTKTITGLNHNTTYNYTVTAVKSAGYAANTSYSGSIKTAQSKVSTPSLSLDSKTTSSVKIKWASVGSSITYYVKSNHPTAAHRNWTNVGSNLSYNFTGLSHNTSYTFYVYATKSGWINSNTASRSETTNQIRLNAPSNLSASNITSSSFRANWSDDSRATSNQIKVWKKDDNMGDSQVVDTTTSNNYYDVTGLQSSKEYYFEVRSSRTGYITSYWRTSPDIDTEAPRLSSPTSITFSHHSTYGQYGFTATASGGDSSGATVSWELLTTGNVLLQTGSGTSKSFTGLSPSTSYKVRARYSKAGYQTSLPKESTTTTLGEWLPTPTITVTNTTTTAISVNISPGEDVYYDYGSSPRWDYQISHNSSFTSIFRDTYNSAYKVYDEDSSITLKSLNTGTTYYIRSRWLSTNSTYRTSNWSGTISSTTLQPTWTTPAITALTNTAAGSNDFEIGFSNAPAYKTFTVETEVYSAGTHTTKYYSNNFSSTSATSRAFFRNIWSDFGGLNVRVRIRIKNVSGYNDSNWSNFSYGKVPAKTFSLSTSVDEDLVRINHPLVPNHGKMYVEVKFGRSTSTDQWDDGDNYIFYNPTTKAVQSDGGITPSDYTVGNTYLEIRKRFASMNPWYFQARYVCNTGEVPHWNYGDWGSTISRNTIAPAPQEITLYGYIDDDGDDMHSVYYEAAYAEQVYVFKQLYSNGPFTNIGTFYMQAGRKVVQLGANGDDLSNIGTHISEYQSAYTTLTNTWGVPVPTSSMFYVGATDLTSSIGGRSSSVKFYFQGQLSGVQSNTSYGPPQIAYGAARDDD